MQKHTTMKTLMYTITLLFAALFHTASAENLFPEIKGWEKQEEIREFNPNTLWDYINGAADSYLKYNFKDLRVAEYRNKAGTYFTVEVYRHASLHDGYGIYASERPDSSNWLQIGDEGYAEAGILNFLADEYYVKLRSSSTKDATLAAMKKVAAAVGKALQPSPGFPAATHCLSRKNRQEAVVPYIAKNLLGYPFLHSAFKATYSSGEKQYTKFLIVTDSVEEAQDMLKQYMKFLDKTAETLQAGFMTFEDPYHGKVHLYWQAGYIAGMVNPPPKPDPEKTLKAMLDCAE